MAEDKVNARLYSTRACHLCEKAEEILQHAGIATERINIVSDIRLIKKYGMRIPVLQRVDNDAELDWPFDSEAASDFLR